jgi:hypothetical protein
MEVALKTLEPYIRSATHLQTGRPFQNFGDMRSREAVVNWKARFKAAWLAFKNKVGPEALAAAYAAMDQNKPERYGR